LSQIPVQRNRQKKNLNEYFNDNKQEIPIGQTEEIEKHDGVAALFL
jgi:hypothetical protein